MFLILDLISIEVNLDDWRISDYNDREFYQSIKPKLLGFDKSQGDKRHLKMQNKYISNNYFATCILKLYENIRGSEPKIAEICRPVQS